MVTPLPLPKLEADTRASLSLLTDNALAQSLGVRVVFSGRSGGVSGDIDEAFRSLNLGAHVNDDPSAVTENRSRLLRAFDAEEDRLIVPTQVHGTHVVYVEKGSEAACAQEAEDAADGVAVAADVNDVAVLLCFADCVPLIVVSPSGAYAVSHAGWRGVYGGIAGDTVRLLAHHDIECGVFLTTEECAASYNVYRGPYIHKECFETGEDVHARFVERFGSTCAPDERHVDLGAALDVDLLEVGIMTERIADADICTVCDNEHYFSYRGQNGTCGRHGALALRERPVS